MCSGATKKVANLAKKYERKVNDNREEVLKNIDFYITQLSEAIECTNSLLDIINQDIENWADSIEALSAVEDMNFFERIEYRILKWYTEKQYSEALKECRIASCAKDKLEYTRNRLMVIQICRG